MKEFNEKVVLVTGGASGIGKAVVEKFLDGGAKVVFTDVNEKLGLKVQQDLGENCLFIKADSSNDLDNKRMVEETMKIFGRLDVAVNNAGIGGASAPVGDLSILDWKKVIDINLNGVFYAMHYQIPALIQTKGNIINVASILGFVGFAQSSAYVAAKHGVLGLTKSAAWEYGLKGVRVNSIGPAFIDTPLLANMDENTLDFLKSQHAFNRLGKAEEVAELVYWLASDKASFATGAYYPIDGGYLAK